MGDSWKRVSLAAFSGKGDPMELIKLLKHLGRDEEATTSVEYAVMLAMILLAVIAGIAGFGNAQNGMWGNIDTQMQAHGIK